MKTKKNPVAVEMAKRYKSSGPMKHRCAPRGGSKNKQQKYLSGDY